MSIPPAISLTVQQQTLRRRLDDEMEKSLRRRPVSAQDQYAEKVARDGDWTIGVQPARSLPLALTQLIPLSLRDEGNRLFEETRDLNNRYAGMSYRTVEIMLASDPERLDLGARALAWGEEVARQVAFKARHRASANPYGTYFDIYSGALTHIDTVMVHGDDRLHQLVWANVLDLLPYCLLDAMLMAPGHLRIEHELDAARLPRAVMSETLRSVANQERLTNVVSLYAVEPGVYLDRFILAPLLAELRATPPSPSLPEQRDAIQGMLADLLEAFPYLMSSERAERQMFRIPGSGCVGTFSFIASNGYAKFGFFDDEEGMLRGVRTNFARTGLEIGYDGRLSSSMHPWRTLDRICSPNDAVMLTYWLLEQVHGRVLADYLRIEHYYLHPSGPDVSVLDAADAPDEALLYVGWAKAAVGEVADKAGDEGMPTEGGQRYGGLPQLRRRTFFKLLAHCGVSVEPGKGSEIKLLRKARHPFRIGNHYGSNPTIPAFLAVAILKRLAITRQEWLDAMAAL